MIKFKNKAGQVVYVHFDDQSNPVEVTKIASDVLRQYGLVPVADEDPKTKKKITLEGVSQDDLSKITGE